MDGLPKLAPSQIIALADMLETASIANNAASLNMSFGFMGFDVFAGFLCFFFSSAELLCRVTQALRTNSCADPLNSSATARHLMALETLYDKRTRIRNR
jgi:hypothetical protein